RQHTRCYRDWSSDVCSSDLENFCRSTVTLSAAIHGASERLRAKVFAIAANLLECAASDLELRKNGVGILGVPGAEVSLSEVAREIGRASCRERGGRAGGAAR